MNWTFQQLNILLNIKSQNNFFSKMRSYILCMLYSKYYYLMTKRIKLRNANSKKKKRNANSNLKCPLCSPVSSVLKKVWAIAGPQLNHR